MSIFDRIGLLVRSNVNAAVSSAEDPEKILEQLLIDMRDSFVSAKQQVAVAIADEKRLEARLSDSKTKSAEWERKAMLAVQHGDDNLAAEALQRQGQEAALATQWQGQWEAQHKATESLRASLLQLNEKIEDAKRKKDLLIARAKRADAQKTIQNTMAGLNDNSAFDAFGRMSDKVDQSEAEANASAELANDVSGASLDDKFKALERSPGSQSDALAALKARMGLAAPAMKSPAQLTAASVDDMPVPDIGVRTATKV